MEFVSLYIHKGLNCNDACFMAAGLRIKYFLQLISQLFYRIFFSLASDILYFISVSGIIKINLNGLFNDVSTTYLKY